MDEKIQAENLPHVLTRQAVVECVNKHLAAIHQFDVRSLALFGSVARNEASSSSDLDFLVTFNGSATFDGYMNLKFFLEDLFGRSVDLVIERDLKTRIRQTVLDEAIYVA